LSASCINPLMDEPQIDNDAELLAKAVFEKLISGEMASLNAEREVIDRNMPFYGLGLAPNAGRLSVRFFLRGTFGQFIVNMKAHHNALEIDCAPGDKKYLPLWRLMQETVSPNSKDKAASPLLAGAVLRSIFSGQPYPELLFNSVITRIRAEHDVSRGKAAIIKAYLLRKYQNDYKEVLTVSLNEGWNGKPYVLGRLFAVLEKAQTEANPGINATIKDRFFTSACATPGMVFSRLIQLANHHTAKAKYGYATEKKIRDLLDKLEVQDDPYPAHLSLREQGEFILGYYHQVKALYTKKDKEEE
jgi:CRISPR-associated protein Csd1